MKRFFVFLIIASVFSSCGSDDEIICTQSDWLGTFVGIEECSGDELVATIEITANGDTDIIIAVNNTTSTVTLSPIAATECSFSSTQAFGILTLKINGSLNGDELRMDTNLSSTTCEYTATRM